MLIKYVGQRPFITQTFVHKQVLFDKTNNFIQEIKDMNFVKTLLETGSFMPVEKKVVEEVKEVKEDIKKDVEDIDEEVYSKKGTYADKEGTYAGIKDIDKRVEEGLARKVKSENTKKS